MALDPEKLEKPFIKLSKSFKKIPKNPTPEQVHDIRTRIRRVESALHALLLDRKNTGKQVLKAVTPVRKRAGKVRDMDVLTGFASTLPHEADNECLVRLLEHLGQERFRDARKLYRTATKREPLARKSLKRCSSMIERNLGQKKNRGSANTWPLDAAAAAMQISGELTAWPKLTTQNLHPFRLKVKELRNVLQLSGGKDDLIEMLDEVKDTIGEWHDWTELSAIAADVLQHDQGCELQKELRSVVQKKLQKAMELANQLRAEYFNQKPKSRTRKRSAKEPGVQRPVLESAAKLAA